VLAGVNEDLLKLVRSPRHFVQACAERGRSNRRDLHEIGSRAHDVQDAFQSVTMISMGRVSRIHKSP
jgi:hypothetical protein